MDYTIQTFGGAEILWKVLNGIAIICSSSYFHKMTTLMIGVALLVTAVQAVPSGSLPTFFKKWLMPTFLLMAFFWGPKVKVNIKDNIDPDFRAVQVANVPFGIALAASMSSNISQMITDVVEQTMTSSDAERFSKVGPMFGARLMYEARLLTIRDPIIRENIKDFTRQCFAWPYIFTNIKPGKKAALETQDMLGFIEANAHKSLGIYWRKPSGQAEFMFCSACAGKVREAISLEVDTGFQALASRLFGGGSDTASQTRRLKQYFGNAWASLANGSSNVGQTIQQELMLNAYRAALQDKREEHGLGRDPALTYLNAERGQIQQDESFFIKAALSGNNVPWLHTLLFCLALMFFAVVAPFTFVSGCAHLIRDFMKMMLWLATWPPLFAILNALGHMFLAKSNASHLVSMGEGLNLMTQSALANSAYHTYAWIVGLQYSVPFVSWALVSGGSGYAMSQFSSFLSQGGEAYAGKAAAEQVDGNMSFDSQTLHHRSVANTQMAQQQLSPNINYGSRFDDGKLATTYGPYRDGDQDRIATHQVAQTQLGTNFSQNDAVSQVMTMQSQWAKATALNHQDMASRHSQKGWQGVYSLTNSLSQGQGVTDTFGNGTSTSIQKSAGFVMDKVNQIAKDRNVSAETAFAGVINAGIGYAEKTGNQGMLSKLKNFAFSLGLSGTASASARDVEAFSQNFKTGEAENFADNLQAVSNYIQDQKASSSNNFTKQQMQGITHSFNVFSQHNELKQASLNLSESFSQSASSSRQGGISSTSNINDSVVGSVAQESFDGNNQLTAQKVSTNPASLQNHSARLMNNEQTRTAATVQDNVSARHQEYKAKIPTAPNMPDEIFQGAEAIEAGRQQLGTHVEEIEGTTKKQIATQQETLKEKKTRRELDHKESERVQQKQEKKSNFRRAGSKVKKSLKGD